MPDLPELSADEVAAAEAEAALLERGDNGPQPDDGEQPESGPYAPLPAPRGAA